MVRWTYAFILLKHAGDGRNPLDAVHFLIAHGTLVRLLVPVFDARLAEEMQARLAADEVRDVLLADGALDDWFQHDQLVFAVTDQSRLLLHRHYTKKFIIGKLKRKVLTGWKQLG